MQRLGASAKTAEGTAKSAGFLKGVSKLLSNPAFWKVIVVIVVIVIILIIVIGFVSFFISGSGLIRGQLLKFADSFWSGWVGFWKGDEDAVKKEEIISIADYLEEMGYDLVNYGFLDTDGKSVTIEKNDDGTETIKNAEGKVILKRELSSDTGEPEITKIKSKYIKAYLAAENKTYIVANQNKNVASVFKNLFRDEEDDDDFDKEANWGTGMIYIEGMSEETANNMGLSETSGNGASRNVKIDRENKKMILTLDGHKYQYSLDGWSGRYGKSIEFLLALQMATMAPDFVYDVATIDEFDTKVHVALYEVDSSIELVYKREDGNYVQITERNCGDFGLNWADVQNYNSDNVKTYTPFITKVTHHWYNNLDFAGCYTNLENDPNTTEDDEKFTYTYEYVGLGEDDDPLANVENLYVREVRKNDIFQINEPKVIDNSAQIKKMLLGSTDEENSENTNPDYKYYIYTGSPISEDNDERQKDYIIKKIQLEDGENGESEYIMNTNAFTYAFAILENVHSEDAEYVLRDLKELFRSIGIKDETLNPDQGNVDNVQPLAWPILTLEEDESGKRIPYKPVVWDPVYDADSSVITIKHKDTSTMGFDKDLDFIMPADGEITQITKGENEEDGDSVKIRLTGTNNRQDLKDMYIYISGIKLDDGVSENSTYSVNQKIGKTIEKDIRIIMTDSKRKSVYNVDSYIQPEEWDFSTADEITDSDFGNDIFGNHSGGDNTPYLGSFSEEFYWYLATLEGMAITTDGYFTNANGGVSRLVINGVPEKYITVGPGIYMLPENCQRFRQRGWTDFDPYSTASVFPKDITIQIFNENIEQVKSVIENYMQGYNLTQKQMEALVLSAFQRGTTPGISTLYSVLDAIKAGKTGNELATIWTRANNKGVRSRRYAEWYVFTYGKYINKDTSREVNFTSSTPFTDMLNGIQSGYMY